MWDDWDWDCVRYSFGALLSFILTIVALYKYLTGNKGYWPSRNIFFLDLTKVTPPTQRWTLQIPIHESEQKMYEAIKSARVDFAGIVEFRTPGLVAIGPDLIKNILVKDFDHFVNRSGVINLKKTDPILHEMLFNKKGQEWKDLRSTLTPAFTSGRVKQMFPRLSESSAKLVKFLDDKLVAKSGGQELDGGGVDFRDGIRRFTMDVIATAAFGFDSRIFENDNADDFSKWGKRLQNQFSGLKFLKLVLGMFAPKILEFFRIPVTDKEAVDFFAGVLSETIRRREESGEKRDDFVQLMIEAKRGELKEETDKSDKLDSFEKDAQLSTKVGKTPLTHDQILSHALLFFVAGFDPTESLLIFAVYEMALNPEVQEELFQEVDAAMANNGRKLSYEDVNRLEYLDKVISETLRKYPTAIRTERKCSQDYKLANSDVVLKKGSVVIIPIYGIHHDADYYPDPEKFDPERFSPEGKAARHSSAYLPFGLGPRSCIAVRFAVLQGKTTLAHLIHKFKIEPSSKTHIPLKFAKVAGFKPESMFLKVSRR